MPDVTSTLLAMYQQICGGSSAREQASLEAEAARRVMLSGLTISPTGVLTLPNFAPGGAHHLTHELGGLDPVNVTGLSGILADGQHPLGHHATHELGGSDVVNLTGLTGLLGTPQTPTLHHTTHEVGGGDVVTVTALAGYPGGTTNFLRADGSFAAPPTGGVPTAHHTTHETGGSDAITALNGSVITTGTIASARLPARFGAVGILIDGGGSVITTGVKGFVEVPFAGTITAATLLSTDAAVTSGSIVIDVWKAAYASYPPTVANTITASAKPTLSSATKSRDATLTGWTTAIAAGDILGFSVTSVTTLTRVALSLTVQAS